MEHDEDYKHNTDWLIEQQFGYELGKLVDGFLLRGINVEVMCSMLTFASAEEMAIRKEQLEAMVDARTDDTWGEPITDYADKHGF